MGTSSTTSELSPDASQRDVAQWFNRTYVEKGFGYLRPQHAYPIFLQLLGVTPGSKLLDVACGPGLLLRAALDKKLEPTGVDLSKEAISLAKRYVPAAEVKEGNAQQLEFADGTFDFVTCLGSIERFFDREKALREIHRVAARDARFCFMVRNSATLVWTVWRRWLRQQNHQGHQDAASLEGWIELFQQTGYEVDGVYIDQWFRQKLRRALRGFRAHDMSRPEPIARPLLPLRYANEFIFILRKSGASSWPKSQNEN